MTRVILISQPFYPDRQATSQLLSSLVQALSERGSKTKEAPLNVSVLCSHPSEVRGSADRSPKRERWRNVEIYRGGLSIDAKQSMFYRALSYGSFLLWLVWRLLFTVKRTDHVLVVTNPPFAPMITGACAKLKSLTRSQFKYSVILHDLYPDGLIALGKVTETWLIRLWRHFNRGALSNAATVITLGRDMSAYLEREYTLDPSHLKVIPNWSPVQFGDQVRRLTAFETELSSLLPHEVIQEDHLLVQYSGNMGLWHNMNGIVDAAAALQNLPIHFLMIGDGRRRAEAEDHADSLGLTNMTWLPFQPLDTLHDSLSCAHLSLVSQRENLLGIMVPSKFYGILASGRGVIAQVPKGSEVALTIEEHECGVVLNNDSAQDLAQCLRQLMTDRAKINQMGIAAREVYESKFSFESAVTAYQNHLTSSQNDLKEAL